MPFSIYLMHLCWIQVLIYFKKVFTNDLTSRDIFALTNLFFYLSSRNLAPRWANDKMLIFKWTTALKKHSLMYSATHHVHQCCEHLNRAPCQAVIRSQNRSAIPHFSLSSKCLKVTPSPGVQTPWCCYSCINRFSNPSLRSCPHLHHYFGD